MFITIRELETGLKTDCKPTCLQRLWQDYITIIQPLTKPGCRSEPPPKKRCAGVGPANALRTYEVLRPLKFRQPFWGCQGGHPPTSMLEACHTNYRRATGNQVNTSNNKGEHMRVGGARINKKSGCILEVTGLGQPFGSNRQISCHCCRFLDRKRAKHFYSPLCLKLAG